MLNTSRGALLGASLLVLLALGCGASDDTNTDDLSSTNEFDATGAVQEPIIGGTQASDFHEAALVTMYSGGTAKALCSGSLIAPRVVLTAGHCIAGYDGWRVTLPYAQNQVATTARAATQYVSTGDTVNRDSNDIGVILLDQALTLDSFPLLQRSALPAGSQGINVGRIDDGQLSSTDLFAGPAQTLQSGSLIGYPYSYYTPVIIQSGDSGGPVVLAGSSPHTLVAVNSGAGGNTQVLARVDLAADWITQHINANGGPGSSGGGTGGAGGASGSGGSAGSAGAGEAGTAGTGGAGQVGGAGQGGAGQGGGAGQEPGGAGGSAGSAPVLCLDGVSEVEPNWVTKPQPIQGSVCAKLGSPLDQDWYVWKAPAAGTRYFFEARGINARLLVWKRVGKFYYPLANQTPQRVSGQASTPGDYYVGVWSPTGLSQPYRLQVTSH